MPLVESLPFKAVARALNEDIHETQPHTLPIQTRAVKLISAMSAIASVAIMIYGIAIKVFAYFCIGTLFLITSLSTLYYIRRIRFLKEIEEDTAEIKTLDENIQKKDVQIVQLTKQIQEITQKLIVEKNDFVQLIQKDQQLEEKYNRLLQDSAQTLAKTEAEGKAALEKTSLELTSQIAELKQQTEKDQQLIVQLNQTVQANQDVIGQLKASIDLLQKQIADYKQQNSNYAELNKGLAEQVKTLGASLRSPDIDVKTISSRADQLSKQLDLNAKQRAETIQSMEKLSAMLANVKKQPPHQSVQKKGI